MAGGYFPQQSQQQKLCLRVESAVSSYRHEI